MQIPTVSVCAMAVWLAGLAGAQVKQADPWLGIMQRGTALEAAGDYAGAAAAFRDALHFAETSTGLRLEIALNALANADDQLGRSSDAEQLYRRALAVEAKAGERNEARALTLGNLGAHYLETGQKDKAASLLRESLEIYLAVVAPDSIQMALCRNALANLVMLQGKYDEAEKLLDLSLAVFRKQSPSNPEQLAIGLNNLGVVRRRQGRNEEAAQLIEESIRITETGLSPDHPTLLRALANLATVYASTGRRDDAGRTFQRALAVGEKRLGTAHPLYAYVLLNYATFLRKCGRKAEAKTLTAQANAVIHDNARVNGRGLTIDVSALLQQH